MLNIIHKLLVNIGHWKINALSLAAVSVVGTIDFLTGYELSFSVFYLAPIVLVTWYSYSWAGYIFCAVCTSVWHFIELHSAHSSHWLIPLWNAGVRLAFFVLTTYLLSALKQQLKLQKMLVRTDYLTQLLNPRAFKNVSSMRFKVGCSTRSPSRTNLY